MDKTNELSDAEALRWLMVSLDVILHDKQYRFEQSDNLWYSRASCEYFGLQDAIYEIIGEVKDALGME